VSEKILSATSARKALNPHWVSQIPGTARSCTNEITNTSCPALIPGLGNRLFGVGSVFGISRSDYEVIAFVEKRLHLLKMRDISGIVGISEETYATGRPAHPLFDSMPFAAIHRTIDNLEMRDFTKHFPHHLACIIRRAIQHNQNLVRETLAVRYSSNLFNVFGSLSASL
jgi:hypothetical protein